MMILEKIARRITPTRFGRWAMNTDGELTLLKARWGIRTCVGIAMILLSFIVGVPGVVLCGFLARKFHEPVILALCELERAALRGTRAPRIDTWLAVNIHAGPVVAGDFGPPGAERYDVVGKTVNVAARLGREIFDRR